MKQLHRIKLFSESTTIYCNVIVLSHREHFDHSFRVSLVPLYLVILCDKYLIVTRAHGECNRDESTDKVAAKVPGHSARRKLRERERERGQSHRDAIASSTDARSRNCAKSFARGYGIDALSSRRYESVYGLVRREPRPARLSAKTNG